jgi:glucan phosphoethanolaminetransferase (alkaline phosphatase superfamily)
MISVAGLLFVGALALAIETLVNRARGRQPPIEPRTAETVAGWASLVAAVMVSAWLLFGPMIASRSTSVGADGTTVTSEQHQTLLESGEMVILPILAIILTIVAMPLVLRRRRARYWLEVWGALILAAFSIISGFSIGLFVMPIAGLMFLAALFGRTSDSTARTELSQTL